MPPPLAGLAKPGPVDAHGWTLLAVTPAAAAKLRQLVPLLDARLVTSGFTPLPIRVKVANHLAGHDTPPVDGDSR